MLIGILVGTIISPRIQHKMGVQHGKKEVLFKKKLEYFEKIIETIEKNKNPQKISILLIYPASIYMGITEAISSEEAILTIHKKISNQDNIHNLDIPIHIDVLPSSDFSPE